jgi:broad specificity phosphatase PhoE
LNYKKLFIVRHGETEFNKLKKVQGSGVDAPLNDTGLKQASAFHSAFKEYPFQKLYVSNLIRTQQSVASFIEQGLPFEKLVGLNEISWGNKEGLAFSPEAHGEYTSVTEAWNRGELDAKITDGESPVEVMARQKLAFDHILAQPEEQLLICMHGRAMRILICWLLGYDLRYMDNFGHADLGLYELTYTGTMFRVNRANDIRHLVNFD